ncbi:MAG: PAS domain-containing protein [Anaerolineae bacterium]|nr:PAS domain-containing protein [Anaerolineae bacterium]
MSYAADFTVDQKLTSADFTVDAPVNIPNLEFGQAVAVAGNWMAVGAPNDNDGNGVVYLYERVSGAWAYRTQIIQPNLQAGTQFGTAVDIYEAGGLVTVIIGAPLFDAAQTNQGRVFIFSDVDTGAGLAFALVTINADTPETNGHFGASVALFADVAAIGSPNHGVSDEGLVIIRGRNVGGSNSWGQIGLTKTGPIGSSFGTSVDLHGEYLIVGAPLAENVAALRGGAAYVYRQDLGGANAWGIKHSLFPSAGQAGHMFGQSVGIWDSNLGATDSTSRSVIGAPLYDDGGTVDAGRVTFFTDATNSGQFTGESANQQYGYSVALEAADAIAGGPTETVSSQPNTGQVNTFNFNGTAWATNITQTGAQTNYFYGYSVDISGLVAVIGAPGSREDALNLPPGAVRAGIIETLEKPGPTWAKDTDSYVIARVDLPNTDADQFFGQDVDMTDQWLAIGVTGDGQKGANAGAVYMYQNVSGVWTPHSKLTALFGQAGDSFGGSVAIHGTRLIVGASAADGFPTTTSNAGAFYSFVFNGTNWVQVAEITSPNPVVNGFFGRSVDYDGDVVVVGASGENGNRGRAYAYRDLSAFSSPITLNIPASSVNSATGFSVSVYDPAAGTANNETIAIGAYNENITQGAAYVLSGSTFSTITTLVDPSPGSNRYFGYSVSIDSGRVAVGAPTATAAPSGRVVVFSGSGYSTADTLTQPTGAGQFGFAVNLDGASLIAGSPATAGRVGAAHVFAFSAGAWAEQGPLAPSDLSTLDEYGISVAQANGQYVVSAPLHNANSIGNSGAAYAFSLAPEVTVAPTTLSVDEEGTTTDTFVVSLNQTPATNVTVQLTFNTQVQVDTGSGFGASPQTVTLTPANATTGVTVTVRAVDDPIDEANTHTTTITTAATSSSTPRFNGLAVDDVTVDITDNDTTGVSITQSGGTTAVTESGTTDTYTIVLDTQPSAAVNVAITFPADLTINGDTDGTYNTTFTTGNWNTAQTITVAAANDRALEGEHSGTIVHAFTSSDAAYEGITAELDGTTATNTITASITDNESAVLTWIPIAASADEGTDSNPFIRLDITADPTGGTPTLEGTISYTLDLALVTAEAADLGTITGTLSFTNVSDLASNMITIPHLTDALVEGDETYTLEIVPGTLPTGMVVTVDATDFTGTITDVNTATLTLTGAATVAESIGTTPLTVTLNIPGGGTLTDAVTVPVNLTDGTATYAAGAGDFSFNGPANTVNVTFPAGSGDGDTEVVDVNITEDVLVEGSEAFSAALGTVTGEALVTGSAQTITITDNESATVSFVSSGSSAPEGTTPHIVQTVLEITSVGTGTPALQDAVTVAVIQTPDTAATPADYTLASSSITFGAGSIDETLLFINITIVNDAVAELNETFDLSFGTVTGTATASGTHEVTIVDNDEPGVTITQTASSTDVDEDGGNDIYTIVLNTEPTSTVNLAIAFAATDLTINGDTDGTYNTTFTTANWNVAQTITVAAVNDRNFESDHSGTIAHAFTSADVIYNGITAEVDGTTSTNNLTANITDNETVELRWVNATGSDSEGQTYIENVVMDITADPTGGTPQNEVAISFEAPITYITAEAADIQVLFISQTINAGNNSGQQFSVFHDFLNDALVEGDETFSMAIDVTTPFPGLTVGADHTATITDVNTATLTLTGAAVVDESVGTIQLTVTLNIPGGATLSDDVTVAVNLTDGTATYAAGAGDFSLTGPANTVNVTFPAGSGDGDTEVVNVNITEDVLVEGFENFSASLGTVTGTATAGPSTQIITITDNEAATVSFVVAARTARRGLGRR